MWPAVQEKLRKICLNAFAEGTNMFYCLIDKNMLLQDKEKKCYTGISIRQAICYLTRAHIIIYSQTAGFSLVIKHPQDLWVAK